MSAPFQRITEPAVERPTEQRPSAAVRLQRLGPRVLQVPLILKLLGANALIAIAAIAVAVPARAPNELLVIWVALLASFAISTLLVRLALLPLDELEEVAKLVTDGDFSARVRTMPTADGQVRRLGEALNRLLSRVNTDRAHVLHLVRESLRAREVERAGLSHQLRETTAQQLAALTLQLAAAMNACKNGEAEPMLRAAHEIASGMADDVRKIADSVYPGLLGRFGLYPALESIRVRARERSGLDVTVDASRCQRALPLGVTTALYGVAEEAIRNVEQHACAGKAHITLESQGNRVELRIEDEGTGFDPESTERHYSGLGLFRARELLAHSGGEMQVISAPGHGTKVVATAYLDDEGTDR
ncbi:MAG: sensor histidine kinase [Gemmatimonadales bacterium]